MCPMLTLLHQLLRKISYCIVHYVHQLIANCVPLHLVLGRCSVGFISQMIILCGFVVITHMGNLY